MESFISNHQFNKITKLMKDYQNTLKFSGDPVIVAASKDITNDGIKEIFIGQDEDVLMHIDICLVDQPEDADQYMNKIQEYTYGVKSVTEKQIRNLFKKEKKLKIPSLENHKKSYYGWVDEGKKKNICGQLVRQ